MEVIFRVTSIYIFILCAFRLIGKRDLGSLSPFDLVVLMIIPEIFSPALTKQDTDLSVAMLGGMTIFALLYFTSVLTARSTAVQRFVEGEPSVLMGNGQLRHEALKRERISPDELLAEARKVGIGDLGDVNWAILENDGRISIIPKERRLRSLRGGAQESHSI